MATAINPWLTRRILLAPHLLRRAAALGIARNGGDGLAERSAAWLLTQPREVRETYAREVVGRPDEARRQQIWMLHQSDEVRTSYAREVLGDDLP